MSLAQASSTENASKRDGHVTGVLPNAVKVYRLKPDSQPVAVSRRRGP